MKKMLILTVYFVLIACTKTEEKPQITLKADQEKPVGDLVCEDKCAPINQKVCDTLFQEYDKCSEKKTESACKEFVTAFSNVLPKNWECTNTCSKEPFLRSASYGCDKVDKAEYPKITERASYLLSELKFATAKDLLLSDKFSEILDGALAEDILPRIEKAKKRK